jgi:glyoxylase-like metal-dependent hydrolase (beta-lactamase superfamily II)
MEEKIMKITKEAYIVGSGNIGIRISHPSDCAVYLFDLGDGSLALVDAGVGIHTEQIVDNIRNEGFDPNRIEHLFITHAHTDHIGGAVYFKENFNCKVYAPISEADNLETIDEKTLGLDVAKKAGFYPPKFIVKQCKVDIRLQDGDEFILGNLKFRAIETPGHSKGGFCFLVLGTKKYLCCGDHISFGGLISLQNYPNSGSSLDGYRDSASKLANLDVDGFLPGHGLFTVNDGQKEVDLMIEAMDDLFVKGRFFLPNKYF